MRLDWLATKKALRFWHQNSRKETKDDETFSNENKLGPRKRSKATQRLSYLAYATWISPRLESVELAETLKKAKNGHG